MTNPESRKLRYTAEESAHLYLLGALIGFIGGAAMMYDLLRGWAR